MEYLIIATICGALGWLVGSRKEPMVVEKYRKAKKGEIHNLSDVAQDVFAKILLNLHGKAGRIADRFIEVDEWQNLSYDDEAYDLRIAISQNGKGMIPQSKYAFPEAVSPNVLGVMVGIKKFYEQGSTIAVIDSNSETRAFVLNKNNVATHEIIATIDEWSINEIVKD